MIANIRRGGYDRLHALPRGEGGGHGVVGRGVGCAVFLGAGRRLKNGVLCGVQTEIDRVEPGDEHPVENAGVVIRPFGDPLNAADERPVGHLQLVLAVFGDDDRAADAVFAGIDEQRLVLLVHPYLDKRGRTKLLNDRITDEALGDTVQWTVETQGSDNDRKLKFAAADGKYLNLINDDNGLRVGADGVNAFNFIVDEGNKRSTFLHAVVNDTSRVVGLYSMFGFSNNWRTKTSIDDQIKSTVTAFFRKSDPGKNDVILTFKNANGEENYNYEADLANGANSFAAPTLEGAPKGAVINYYSSNDLYAACR